MQSRSERDIFLSLVIPVGAVLIFTVALRAQAPPRDPPHPLASLKTVPVPEPANLADFVADKAAAIRLGKALFWDMQAGSDGIQACASCHFHAGADNRRKNQLSPGLLAGDTTFQVGGPNYTLRAKDFPFTRHADENAAGSPIVSDANDVASSQGVFHTSFIDVTPGRAADACASVADPVFQVQGINVRRVEPRNTPSMVNAVFNFDNFWDGRADHIFNGVSPFGDLDMADKAIFTVQLLHQNEHGELTQPRLQGRFGHEIVRQRKDPCCQPRAIRQRFDHIGNATHVELFFESIVEFFHFPGSGLLLDVRNSWHGSLLIRTKIVPSLYRSCPPLGKRTALTHQISRSTTRFS